MKNKILILIMMLTTMSLLSSCTAQINRGANAIDCKEVIQYCAGKGYYDEWILQNGGVACSCHEYK